MPEIILHELFDRPQSLAALVAKPFRQADLFGAVRDEIVTATVKGTPADMKVSTMQFADTRRVLSELLGNDSGPSRDRRDVGRGRIESRPTPRLVPPVSGEEGDYTIADEHAVSSAQHKDSSHD